MLFGKKIRCGLDVGTYSLQWTGYESRSHKCEVWRAPIHSHEVEGRPEASYGEKLVSLLRKCEKETKYWDKTVTVGVQGASVICGYLDFPPLKESELEMAVLSSVSREIPFPINTMDVVHLPVESLEPGRTAVFYSVWPKTETARLQELCTACDLKIRRIEATGIGLTRELYRNRTLDPEKFYAVINIGHEVTQVVMVRGGYPYYLRDIPMGGRDITYAIAVGAQISWVEAEALKHREPLFEFFSSAGPALQELSYELGRSFKYFQRQFRVTSVEKAFLSGGGSLTPDFQEWLQEELEIPLRSESWEKLQPRSSGQDSRLHKVSIGLALGR